MSGTVKTSAAAHTVDDDDRPAELARKLGQWLDAHGIRWCWSYEGDSWIHGGVPAARQVPGGIR